MHILHSCSSPRLHVPAYNFKTRNEAFKIYQIFVLQKDLLLQQIKDPHLFIQAVLAAIEGEKDPRNLVIGFDLILYII